MPIVSGFTHTLSPADHGTRVRIKALQEAEVTIEVGSTQFTWTPGTVIEVINTSTEPVSFVFAGGGQGEVTVNVYNGPDLAPGAYCRVYCVTPTEFDVHIHPSLDGVARLGTYNTFTKGHTVTPVEVTPSGSQLWIDPSLSNSFILPMAGALTLNLNLGTHDGQIVNIAVQNDGSALSFGHTMFWAGGVPPTNTQVSGSIDLITAQYFDTLGAWLCTISKDFGTTVVLMP